MNVEKNSVNYRDVINYETYPIDNVADKQCQKVVDSARQSLAKDGCAVLNGFLSEQGLNLILQETLKRREAAYFSKNKDANVYFSTDDESLPSTHPRRIFLERSNGFITSDLFDDQTVARQLYNWQPLSRFIADCLNKEKLYIYEDPVSNMIVNVGKPGTQFNWHFDTNEFTITMLLKAAKSGGVFEYVPNLRTARDECYDEVTKVLTGNRDRVEQLPLTPGDLQLFLGRFSLHRVTENTSDDDRLLIIMSFADKPGMIGSVERSKQLYGKVTQIHLDAEKNSVRADNLMD